jgi:hypothetical protein
MFSPRRLSDWINVIVIILTFLLFGIALLVKGVTRDFLLEAAVFLISVKLIVSTYKISKKLEEIDKKLDS